MLQPTHVPAVVVLVILVVLGAFGRTIQVDFAPRFANDDPPWVAKQDGIGQWSQGVFHSDRHQKFNEEVAATIKLMQLRPGMTYCEVGAANGLWAVTLASAVMPGGRIFATVGTAEEKPVVLAAAAHAGIPANVSRGGETESGLPLDEQCDVLMSRMSFFYVSRPDVYAHQFFLALKPGGRMLITDHGPMTPQMYAGPRGPNSYMKVTAGTEQADFERAGFKTIQQLDWTSFFHMGFANLMGKPNKYARSPINISAGSHRA